jgi:very-long-chain (3R)-3-hydroxyacyl-CoA dehydratase
MNIAPPAQTSIFTVLACTSWGLVEVPRYLFYALNLLNAVPYPLFWLRYRSVIGIHAFLCVHKYFHSLFAILYPTGITGELGCMYEAAKYFVETQEYTLIPIASIPEFKIPFLYIIIAVALTYIPGIELCHSAITMGLSSSYILVVYLFIRT